MKWFIADTHFDDHNLTISMLSRGANGAYFTCGEEHDAYLLNEINFHVDRSDELYIVGDFGETRPGFWRGLIKCRHVKLVLGNHDQRSKCDHVFGRSWERIRGVKIFNHDQSDYIKAVLDHYPGAYWDGSHKGWCQLYGHTHSQREATLEELFPQRLALDVGVDNTLRLFGRLGPVSEVEVYNYMAARSGHDDVRFYIDLQEGGHFSKYFDNKG